MSQRNDVREETKSVPPRVRAECAERDGSMCRVCGRWVDPPALHHITFRSQGGLHVATNLITVGWLPAHDCHLTICHGPEAAIWAPYFRRLAAGEPGTAIGLRRAAEGLSTAQAKRAWRAL